MSARKATVHLQPAASRDVRSILLHTGDHWGAAQQNAYREAINRALATLSANPHIGRLRSDIAPDFYSYRVRQHIIYYRLNTGTVTVLRVLHGKMDAAQHLFED